MNMDQIKAVGGIFSICYNLFVNRINFYNMNYCKPNFGVLGNHSSMFGPLEFDRVQNDPPEDEVETPCLLCDDSFNLKIGFHIFLKHLFEVHRLVIEDVQNIANLHR